MCAHLCVDAGVRAGVVFSLGVFLRPRTSRFQPPPLSLSPYSLSVCVPLRLCLSVCLSVCLVVYTLPSFLPPSLSVIPRSLCLPLSLARSPLSLLPCLHFSPSLHESVCAHASALSLSRALSLSLARSLNRSSKGSLECVCVRARSLSQFRMYALDPLTHSRMMTPHHAL